MLSIKKVIHPDTLIGKTIRIIIAPDKDLINKTGTITSPFGKFRKDILGLFLDVPLNNGQDTINIDDNIKFEILKD
jgi:hypothetical protein